MRVWSEVRRVRGEEGEQSLTPRGVSTDCAR